MLALLWCRRPSWIPPPTKEVSVDVLMVLQGMIIVVASGVHRIISIYGLCFQQRYHGIGHSMMGFRDSGSMLLCGLSSRILLPSFLRHALVLILGL